MTPIKSETLAAIAGRPANGNMESVALGLASGAAMAGLTLPHRLAHFLAQVGHESSGFRYDREVWGPSAAQKRYEDRSDLGHSAAVPGEAFQFRGRTGIQITGRANTREFRDWCRSRFSDVPDFEAEPDAMLSDPWEGLGPIWYWDTRHLNRYADVNDIEMVTRRVNGGLNGYQDRLRWYSRSALVLLGMSPTAVREFQKTAGLAVDGIAGPRTRAALHSALQAQPALPAVVDPLPDDRHPAEVALERIATIISEYQET